MSSYPFECIRLQKRVKKRSCHIHRLPIAREGYPFIGGAILGAIIFYLLNLPLFTAIFLFFGIASLIFFRNPKRTTVADHEEIVSPADGTVLRIEQAIEPRFLKQATRKLSIYMSSLNVHVNRNPISGIVKDQQYQKGKFSLAKKDKASLDNEQNALFLQANNQKQMVLVQIAGFVARRIVCYPKPGDLVRAGEPLGIIRFGSRVDLYLPLDVTLRVKVGEKVVAGETIIGAFNAN